MISKIKISMSVLILSASCFELLLVLTKVESIRPYLFVFVFPCLDLSLCVRFCLLSTLFVIF